MRNTLKFSLLSALLCTMVIGNSGYSMQREYYNNNNNYNNNITEKTTDDLLQQFEEAKNNIKNHSSIYPHAGLVNISATCYMNACLQCLANDTDFVKSFLEEVKLKYQKLKFSEDQEDKLVLELAKVMAQLWILPFKNGYFEENTYYDASKFQKILVQCNHLFKEGIPSDSKDLLLYLFETIHKVLRLKSEIFPGNNSIEYAQQYFKNNKSCISDIFYFVTESKMTCQLCNSVTTNYNISNFLIFPLEEVRKIKQRQQMLYSNFTINNRTVTINDCFAYDNKINHLTGDNMIFCNNCGQYSNATIQNQISYTPNTLAIVLNRGRNNIYNVKMPIPENIDLNTLVHYKTIDGEIYYLSSVICHIKGNNNDSYSNHFITLAKTTPYSPWVRYNDSLVNALGDSDGKKYINDVLSGDSKVTPYILFYKKMNSAAKNNPNLLKEVYKVRPNMSNINQSQNAFSMYNNFNIYSNMYSNMNSINYNKYNKNK